MMIFLLLQLHEWNAHRTEDEAADFCITAETTFAERQKRFSYSHLCFRFSGSVLRDVRRPSDISTS